MSIERYNRNRNSSSFKKLIYLKTNTGRKFCDGGFGLKTSPVLVNNIRTSSDVINDIHKSQEVGGRWWVGRITL